METLGLDIAFVHSIRLLAIVPAVTAVCAFFVWNFFAAQRAFKKVPLLNLHFEEASPKWGAYALNVLGFSAILALLILACAEPEQKTKVGEAIYGGVRACFMLDVSLSMKYAHDVAPYPDRLTAAKSVLEGFAAMTENDPELRGKYWRCIIVFAGKAMVYLPFSASHDEFVSAINEIDEQTVNTPGTNLLGPFMEYEWLLKRYPPTTSETLDMLVLISDGGKEDGTYEDLPYIKAAQKRLKNTLTYSVGIGSVSVTTLPDGTHIRKSIKVPMIVMDRRGKVIRYELKDPDDPKSERAYRTLDEYALQEISGKDRYVFYEGKEALLQKLKQAIIENRKPTDTVWHTRTAPIAGWFLVPAIFLACLMFGYIRRLLALILFFPSRLARRFSR